MKIWLISLTLALLSAGAYCQTKNCLSIVFGIAGNDVGFIGIGGAGYRGKGESMYGFNYSRNLTKSFSIETGLEYSVNNVQLDYTDPPRPSFVPINASIKMLSIPFYANVTFLKYLFADAGVTADFETSHQSDAIVSDQSGISLGLGIGGKYNFNKIVVFINPFLQLHAIAAFRHAGEGSLSDQGVKFGIGYRF